jgi:hypothetical protein
LDLFPFVAELLVARRELTVSHDDAALKILKDAYAKGLTDVDIEIWTRRQLEAAKVAVQATKTTQYPKGWSRIALLARASALG